MSAQPFTLWVFLTQTPLFWLTVTLLVYLGTDWVSQRSGRHPLAGPVPHSVWIIGGLLLLTGTPYRAYFEGAQFIHFLLGPATVALAVPLYQHRRIVLHSLLPMFAALAVGSVTAMGSALLIAGALGVPREVLIALAPKSVTAAVAMGITQALGGDPSLAVVFVMLTGVIGAIAVTPLMNLVGARDWRARGFAVGLSAHGIGTARAFQVHHLAGTFAGIAMGLNALVTAIIAPLVLALLPG